MFGEKANQRSVCFSFHSRRAQFDLNCATMSATGGTRCSEHPCDAVTFSVWNDVNPQSCHSAMIPERRRTRSTDFGVACDGASMKARQFYLICCVLGLLLPYTQFVPWALEHGFNITLFCRELFANRISAFFAMDVIVSAIALIWFIQGEGKRLRLRALWLPTVGTLIVGVSFGLPLFLFLRQLTLDRTIVRA